MKLEPIIKAKLTKFKDDFEYTLSDDLAFERFANYTILQRHQPGAFISDADLLEAVCVGGEKDTGIDGLCIKINGSLVKSITDAEYLVKNSNKINIDFIFIQSKNKDSFKQSDYSQFLNGVKDFVAPIQYQPQNAKIKEWLEIKKFLINDNVCSKWERNPSIFLYYVFMGEGSGGQYIQAADKRFIDEVKTYKMYDSNNIEHVDSGKLKKYCDENENQYEARLNILEACSFLGENEEIRDVGFNSTVAICRASELLKLLVSEDGLLRKNIFDDNVRDYQGETSINSEILNTIKESPKDFVLYNNGITIVCENLITNGKNLNIKNPQIVNGCQTCNVIYNARNLPNSTNALSSVKVIVKIISTSNNELINKVVRGTNKQNIVQDEAFETIREFHKNLEEFFLSANSTFNLPFPLYYERRSRQYDGMKIKEVSKVRFSMLIRGFVSTFLSEPHRGVNHPATLQKEYKDKIFNDKQSLLPYYVSAQVNAYIEIACRADKLPHDVKSFKMHLAYLFCLLNAGFFPNINNSKQVDAYSENIIKVLQNKDITNKKLEEAINLFNIARTEWIESKGIEHKYGIKDRAEFTKLLNELVSKIINKQQISDLLQNRGRIDTVKQNLQGQWFGFIRKNDGSEIYFNGEGLDETNFSSFIGKDVLYDIGEGHKGEKAINIVFIE